MSDKSPVPKLEPVMSLWKGSFWNQNLS